MSHTGENEQGLRKISDFTRFASIFILLLHFYYYCYAAFKQWEIKSTITDRLMTNIMDTGLFSNQYTSRFLVIGLLIISLLGAQGKKDQKINWKSVTAYLLIGLLLFFGSKILLSLNYSVENIAIIYMTVTGIGYLLILAGGNLLSRLINLNLSNDIFNSLNETFPQEERFFIQRIFHQSSCQIQFKKQGKKKLDKYHQSIQRIISYWKSWLRKKLVCNPACHQTAY